MSRIHLAVPLPALSPSVQQSIDQPKHHLQTAENLILRTQGAPRPQRIGPSYSFVRSKFRTISPNAPVVTSEAVQIMQNIKPISLVGGTGCTFVIAPAASFQADKFVHPFTGPRSPVGSGAESIGHKLPSRLSSRVPVAA